MEYDLVIIGAGPGGYVAAIRAGQLGLKTVLIEKSHVGGMCLNWGCIPTKALLESAKRLQVVKNVAAFGVDGVDIDQLSLNWKTAVKRADRIVKRLTKGVEYLLKKNGVTVITGTARINADKTVSVENIQISAKNIIIATGSKPVPIEASIPAERIIEVENLLKLEELPESVMVFGNKAHSVELAQFFSLAGKRSTLVTPEATLIPNSDPFLSDYAVKILKKSNVDVRLSSGINELEDGQVIVNASDRLPVVPESAISFEMENGRMKVNEKMETSAPGIYAVGDVNGKSMYAHAASSQGLYVVNRINGINLETPFELSKIPINIYTTPEMAQVGLTEPQVEKVSGLYKIGEFPLTANGKALIEGETEGSVRILADKKYGEVLGVQIVAPHATDMIAEAALLMEMEGTVYDVAATIHAHPTISEIFMEAGFDAFDQAIHV